ncbi:hypothetical protein EGW08_005833 [Elysia chlorotica]|uniref:Uncharacterized protein n=1 Tax=Elysia chlorotica TaxID=188477 RepID=A0A433TXQ4_ELYCH|nr:hypothetical protein EGW08_005833 [Elysia chlorotica]
MCICNERQDKSWPKILFYWHSVNTYSFFSQRSYCMVHTKNMSRCVVPGSCAKKKNTKKGKKSYLQSFANLWVLDKYQFQRLQCFCVRFLFCFVFNVDSYNLRCDNSLCH